MVQDFAERNVTTSSTLSAVICREKLGQNYPTLSGIIRMRCGNGVWDFEGGIDPRW